MRQQEQLHAMGLSICSSVSVSPKYKKTIFSKSKQLAGMVSIDDL